MTASSVFHWRFRARKESGVCVMHFRSFRVPTLSFCKQVYVLIFTWIVFNTEWILIWRFYNLVLVSSSCPPARSLHLCRTKCRVRHNARLYLLFTGKRWFPFFALDVAATRRESHTTWKYHILCSTNENVLNFNCLLFSTCEPFDYVWPILLTLVFFLLHYHTSLVFFIQK